VTSNKVGNTENSSGSLNQHGGSAGPRSKSRYLPRAGCRAASPANGMTITTTTIKMPNGITTCES